jgi:hypothetical protein
MAAFWTGLAGAVLNLAAALWLLIGFRPNDPRYAKAGKFGFERHAKGVRVSLPDPGNLSELLRQQQRPVGLVVLGSALQLLSVVLQLAGD